MEMELKAISIWQPYASLIVHGHKFTETRSWNAPKSLIGKRIAIASTKKIQPEQTALISNLEFMDHYDNTMMPFIKDLPMGYIVGTAILNSSDIMTEEDLNDITDEERMFGVWEVGRYAWRMRDPIFHQDPQQCKGQQGIWEWKEDEINRMLRGDKAR